MNSVCDENDWESPPNPPRKLLGQVSIRRAVQRVLPGGPQPYGAQSLKNRVRVNYYFDEKMRIYDFPHLKIDRDGKAFLLWFFVQNIFIYNFFFSHIFPMLFRLTLPIIYIYNIITIFKK